MIRHAGRRDVLDERFKIGRRPSPELLFELSPRRLLRRFTGDVQQPSRDLEQLLVDRGAVLAHEEHVVTVEHNHGNRARMPDELTVELIAVRRLERSTDDGEKRTAVADLFARATEFRHRDGVRR